MILRIYTFLIEATGPTLGENVTMFDGVKDNSLTRNDFIFESFIIAQNYVLLL